MSSSMATGTLAAATLLPWECDSASKYSPIKLEPSPDSLDDIVLSQSASSDFAELKPLPYDYEATSLTGLDPVLTNNNNNNNILSNNNNKHVSDLNISSPGSSSGISSGQSVPSRLSNTSNFSSSSSSSGIASNPPSINIHGGQSDVTSSGTNSPPTGVTKLEVVDFTASKDAFDDLASIVGMSMGADSTVPTVEGTGDASDLDWIENIKPLGDLNFEGMAIPSVAASASS